jgi:putative transposase
MDIRNQPIEPERFYHIYNRGINGEVIFNSKRNFDFFLKKVEDYLVPVCEIYSYCLLSNHFHFLVHVKSENELESLVKVRNLDKAERGLHAPQNIFSKQFSKLFNSYSQAFNKENGRHGSLIESPFKRKEIKDIDYLRKVVIYIHRNPQSHGIVSDFRDYNYSSYKGIINNSVNFLKKKEVIELFADKENFIFCHNMELD